MAERVESGARSDWEAPEGAPPGRAVAATAALWACGATAGGIAAAVLGAPTVAGVAVVVLLLVADLATIGRRALRRVGVRGGGARPARLVNIVEGVAADLGLASVRTETFPAGAPQALVCRAGGPVVAVSQGALDGLTRTELESVVAHCLVRLATGNVRTATVAAHLGPLGRAAGTVVGPHEDVVAVALTRYPPALVSALAKCPPARGRSAPLHFVADHPCHTPASERAAVVADL